MIGRVVAASLPRDPKLTTHHTTSTSGTQLARDLCSYLSTRQKLWVSFIFLTIFKQWKGLRLSLRSKPYGHLSNPTQHYIYKYVGPTVKWSFPRSTNLYLPRNIQLARLPIIVKTKLQEREGVKFLGKVFYNALRHSLRYINYIHRLARPRNTTCYKLKKSADFFLLPIL